MVHKGTPRRYKLSTVVLMTFGLSLPFLYTWWAEDLARAIPTLVFPAAAFLVLGLDAYARRNRERFNSMLRFLGLLPTVSEAMLFVMSLTMIILLFGTTDLASEWLKWMDVGEGVAFIATLYVLIGMFLSLYHAFSLKKKGKGTQRMFQWYVELTLCAVALSTAFHIAESGEYSLLLFALWNLVQAALLLLFTGESRPGEYIEISQRQAKATELAIGALTVLLVVTIETRILETHWSIIFSSVLITWSFVESALQRTVLVR